MITLQILFGCTPLYVFFYFVIWPEIRWRVLEFLGFGKEVILFRHDGGEYRSFEPSSAKGIVYIYPNERVGVVGVVTLLKNGETAGSIFVEDGYDFISKFLPNDTLHVIGWRYARP